MESEKGRKIEYNLGKKRSQARIYSRGEKIKYGRIKTVGYTLNILIIIELFPPTDQIQRYFVCRDP